MLLCLQHLVTLADVLPVDRTRRALLCGTGTGSVHQGSKGVTLLSAARPGSPGARLLPRPRWPCLPHDRPVSQEVKCGSHE